MLTWLREQWQAFRRLWSLLAVVEWPCGYCRTRNYTPILLWKQVRYGLLCERCAKMQNYPDHIAEFDPDPPDHVRERRTQRAAVHSS